MNRSRFEALKEIVERVSQTIKEGLVLDAYLAGGMAVYVHTVDRTKNKNEVRYSEDVDIQFTRSLNLSDEIVVLYEDRAGKERALMLDRNYNSTLGLYHPDAFDAATSLFHSANGRVHLKILTPIDLAVTKTGRFQDHDRQDIESLARCGLINADAFEKRATEAVEYLATDAKPVLANIQDAMKLIRRESRTLTP